MTRSRDREEGKPIDEAIGGEKHDARLGMDRPIDRRDFLQGAAVALATTVGGLTPGLSLADEAANPIAAAQDQPGYYPPTLMVCAAVIPVHSRVLTQ